MTDSFYPDNQGEYILQVKDGLLNVLDGGDVEVEVKIEIAELSSLFMGVVTLKELYMYSKIEIDDTTFLDILNNLFSSLEKPICMTAF